MTEDRLQKILAHAGYGSRRQCESMIEAGRVTVNGQRAKLGDKADPERDQIRLDGSQLRSAPDLVYIALYKPRFVVSSAKSQGNYQTVLELVPDGERLFPVGRLDVESEGLMLLTNDGDLANRLTHPRYGHEKEYRVLLARQPDEKQLQAWRSGVVLSDGYQTKPTKVRVERLQGKGAWLRVTMSEGRKRQIRETAAQLGLPVVKLVRVRIASVKLGRLRPRQWRKLEAAEVREIMGEKGKGGKKKEGRRKR